MIALKAFFNALKNEPVAQKKIEEKKDESGSIEHLRLLSLLQHSARLIDFLKEDISGYQDAEVGAAVRQIHSDCSKLLEDLVTIRPLLEDKEGSVITVPKGYDPSEIKVIGKVKGEPPFKGTLRHPGWKAHKLSLPKKIHDEKREVISPAEIEV